MSGIDDRSRVLLDKALGEHQSGYVSTDEVPVIRAALDAIQAALRSALPSREAIVEILSDTLVIKGRHDPEIRGIDEATDAILAAEVQA